MSFRVAGSCEPCRGLEGSVWIRDFRESVSMLTMGLEQRPWVGEDLTRVEGREEETSSLVLPKEGHGRPGA